MKFFFLTASHCRTYNTHATQEQRAGSSYEDPWSQIEGHPAN